MDLLTDARHSRAVHALILSIACLGVFSNSFNHEFNLDSGYGIESNSYVRSLKNVPLFFQDPLTLTINRANRDYRPVLQTTYALNYAVSGYEMWSWHLVQIILHAICAISLYVLCRKIATLSRQGESALASHAALVVSLVFVLHPTGSGVVNYLWARSSLLVAAFLLPSFILYMKPASSPSYRRIPWVPLLLFTLALFTKIEALSALGVYFLYDAILAPLGEGEQRGARAGSPQGSRSLLGDLVRALNWTTLRRLWPFMAVSLVYFVIRSRIDVGPFAGSALNASNSSSSSHLLTPLTSLLETLFRWFTPSSFSYPLTQLTAWWHYIFQWFVPVNLVHDDPSYPTFSSFLAPQVLFAAGGWFIVACILKATYRKHPHVMFLALSSLALISPTSSIKELHEMVNEHRPYLPLAVLSLAWLYPLILSFLKASREKTSLRVIGSGLIVLTLISLGWMTLKRNLVFRTVEGYWQEIEAKAPSDRSTMNLGVLLMQRGEFEGAIARFEESLRGSPWWTPTHINLALSYEGIGKPDLALKHYSIAVECDLETSRALVYRGEFYLSKGLYNPAYADFEASVPEAVQLFRVYKGLATASAGLGHWQECLKHTVECLRLAPDATELSIIEISTPFWGSEELYQSGIDYYSALLEHLPDRWYLHANIGHLAAKLGQTELAERSLELGSKLKDEGG